MTQEALQAVEEVRKLASRECRPLEGPVVIVAGGCDPSIEQQMKAYRDLLVEAFRDFRGTVIGGGTREGISGLVGEVGEVYRGCMCKATCERGISSASMRPTGIPVHAASVSATACALTQGWTSGVLP